MKIKVNLPIINKVLKLLKPKEIGITQEMIDELEIEKKFNKKNEKIGTNSDPPTGGEECRTISDPGSGGHQTRR